MERQWQRAEEGLLHVPCDRYFQTTSDKVELAPLVTKKERLIISFGLS